MKININNTISVKLTKAGIKHWNTYWKEKLSYKGIPAHIPEIPKNKIIKIELWHIMQVFGNGIYHGMPKSFFKDNEIDVEI